MTKLSKDIMEKLIWPIMTPLHLDTTRRLVEVMSLPTLRGSFLHTII